MTKEQKAAKEAEEQQQRTLDNIKENAKGMYEATKAQIETRADVNNAMDMLINITPSIHKQEVANAVYQVRKLLKELESGGNKEQIINKLKALIAK